MSTIRDVIAALDERAARQTSEAGDYLSLRGASTDPAGGLVRRFSAADLDALPTLPVAAEITQSTCDALPASERTPYHPRRATSRSPYRS